MEPGVFKTSLNSTLTYIQQDYITNVLFNDYKTTMKNK